MKIDREKIKESLRWRNIKKASFNFLEKKIRWPFFLLILLMAGYGAYLWYFHVYHPEWSEGRKKEYRETKGKGEAFNKNKFNEVLENYNLRGERFGRSMDEAEDIFGLDNKE